jgi:hypothetical protein
MKLKTLLIINAAIAAVFGLAFVLVPSQVASLYGVEANAAMDYMGRLFGAALIGYAFLTWLARNANESTARSAIVLALLIGNGVGFAVALISQINGVVNALGWSTVAAYLLLGLGYAYFQFAAPAPQEAPRPAS